MRLIQAYGGSLCNLVLPDSSREATLLETSSLPSHCLSPSQICDLEALMCGAFSPLSGYLSEADYRSVLQKKRLTNHLFWPIPITLAVASETAVAIGERLLLRDEEGTPLAFLTVSDRFSPDLVAESRLLYGKTEGGSTLDYGPDTVYLGGRVTGIQLPKHYDFGDLRKTPAQVRDLLPSHGQVIAFCAAYPLVSGIEQALRRSVDGQSVQLLLHLPTVSDSSQTLAFSGRARCYRRAAVRLNPTGLGLNLFPLLPRSECHLDLCLRALVFRNYGCNQLAIDSTMESSQALATLKEFASELAVTVIPLQPEPTTQSQAGGSQRADTQHLLDVLTAGDPLPDSLVHPQDVAVLRRAYPARSDVGLVLFFTGLSGSGKSTLAKALCAVLAAYDRPVSLLDGDVVRLNLSKGLGFSKEDRDCNIRRIGFVASLVAKCGGIAICAPIAPYRETRADVRRMVSLHGRFVEIHVATDLVICESRDPKGLYARARKGLIKGFTGIDDPYELPEHPELRLDTHSLSVVQCLEAICAWLVAERYLPSVRI